MSELKQRETEFEADALRINAGRKPKFGDLMRNPWASDTNPRRDAYFVRQDGRYYEFTNKKGDFWKTHAKYAFFIDARPEANADAKDAITDTQRMDFQQSNPNMYFNVHKKGKYWRFGHFSNYPQECYSSARDAIDAAINAARQAKENGE